MNLKNIILVLIISLALAGLVSCNSGNDSKVPADVVYIPNTAEGNADMDRLPKFEFKETTHDFGKLIDGEIVTYAFKFKNTGNSDLIISNVSATCGCTATEYIRDPVRPGGEGYLNVTFNSAGKLGFQSKTVTVAANTQPANTVLTITAKVVSPK
jgi:hypothetical protein